MSGEGTPWYDAPTRVSLGLGAASLLTDPIPLDHGGTGQATAALACEALGAIRRQVRVWTTYGQAPGLTGPYGLSATGYAPVVVNDAIVAGFTNTPASTNAYGLTATSPRYEYLGGNVLFDATVKFHAGDPTKNRVYVGLVKSTWAGARTGGPVGIYFCWDGPAGDTSWWLVTNNGTTREAYNTGVSLSGWVRLRCEVRSGTVYGYVWTSSTDPRMVGVTPTTFTRMPALPSAQDCGVELYGQPGTADTVTFYVFDLVTGQVMS